VSRVLASDFATFTPNTPSTSAVLAIADLQ